MSDKIRFLRNGIILTMFLSFVIILLNIFYLNTVEKSKVIIRQEVEWQKYRKTIDNNHLEYAFLGDSHTRDGINPEFINNSYNFGTAAEDYVETYYKLLKLIDKEDIKIDNIVMEIDPQVFSDRLREDERIFYELNYYSKFVDLKNISELRNESLTTVYINKYFIILSNGINILNYYFLDYIRVQEYTILKNGWANVSRDFSELNKTQLTTRVYKSHYSEEPFLLENKSLTYFKKILALADERNINIILVKLPLSYEYVYELEKHNVSIEEHYNELFNEINSVTNDYEIMDYQNDYANNSSYFSDADHLNNRGSEIFSRRLSEDLINLK